MSAAAVDVGPKLDLFELAERWAETNGGLFDLSAWATVEVAGCDALSQPGEFFGGLAAASHVLDA